ncbi:MAG: inositol monophosphatase [Anaerolineales bacterium]|nr:inositol monophosphatase [Anaerolineales bacterium]MDW8227485.1 inositol monophosphatase family protein [Anaerolineales bacterium]
MNEFDVMIYAAKRAGNLLRRHFGQLHNSRTKASAINLVTEMDERAQTLILETLQTAFPDYGFLAEEAPQAPPEDRPYWIIDPLDGTTNFVHGYPFLAISIALAEGKVVQAGVVYQPLSRELFTAVRGKGAMLNNRPIHVSHASNLATCLLASGFPYDAWENPNNNSRQWSAMLRRVVSLRSDGSAALDLCYVACGRLDGYWELDLDPWDMAAGSLIVAEAGGWLSNQDGEAFDLFGRSIVASSPGIHRDMLEVLQSC